MIKNPTIFRYPGGKAKLSPYIINLIKQQITEDLFVQKNNINFVDVFVGGGSIFSSIIGEINFNEVHINDLDEWMFNFWNILNSEENVFASFKEMIRSANITIDTFVTMKNNNQILDNQQKAFAALFFNRTTFSGILQSGPIGGYRQEGKYKINCRWNSKNLLKKIDILRAACINNNIFVHKKDFKDIIKEHYKNPNAFLYLDPPYITQGSTLYRHWMTEKDYLDMADMLKEAKCMWLLSHDDNPKFVDMYKEWANIDNIEKVSYTINSIKGKKRTELLIHPKKKKYELRNKN